MKLNELVVDPGSRKRRRRIGRGTGSGRGDYSGKGMKGQKSRSGGGVRRGFEGGQNALIKRLGYKRGFTNIFRIEYNVVNLSRLQHMGAQDEITPELLLKNGIVKSLKKPVKILGIGEIGSSVIVKAHKFSASAKSKIEAAGGHAEEI